MTWTLSASAFESLLTALHTDRARAADRYEALRARLVKFFEWRGCAQPQDLADRTIDRVARRLAEGAAITAADPFQYFHGVALNVLKEHWRAPDRTHEPLDDADPPGSATENPAERDARAAERTEHEQRLECLERCLDALPPESRVLVARYHLEISTARMDARRTLAASLGIPLNALRIRAFRLRQTLERCVVSCEGKQGAPHEMSERIRH
jgi:DNA-directed RNA polymerase specialized sigma24 family protein